MSFTKKLRCPTCPLHFARCFFDDMFSFSLYFLVWTQFPLLSVAVGLSCLPCYPEAHRPTYSAVCYFDPVASLFRDRSLRPPPPPPPACFPGVVSFTHLLSPHLLPAFAFVFFPFPLPHVAFVLACIPLSLALPFMHTGVTPSAQSKYLGILPLSPHPRFSSWPCTSIPFCNFCAASAS